MRQYILLWGPIFCLSILACRGPDGPQGPMGPGIEQLTDPSILPRVLYTIPAPYSQGPYGHPTRLIIGFNKVMDPDWLRRSMRISSSYGRTISDGSQVQMTTGNVASTYIYARDQHWRIQEACTVRINSTARDINGNALTPPFSMTFIPEPFFRVKYSSPTSGDTLVPTYERLYLEFNTPVDSTIYPSIRIQPHVAGRWWPDFYYPGIYFAPSTQFAANTTYTLRIETSARNIYGDQLPTLYTLSFSTGAFQVNGSYPKPGQRTNDLWSSIRLSFTELLDTSSVPGAFSTIPILQGRFEYSIPPHNSFWFTPDELLERNKRYRVTVSTAIRSESGQNLLAPYVFEFLSPGFEVTGTTPRNRETDYYSLAALHVDFSGPIDSSTVRSAFEIRPTVVGTFAFSSQAFSFEPVSSFALNTRYTVTIRPSLRMPNGVPLESGYAFWFVTGKQ